MTKNAQNWTIAIVIIVIIAALAIWGYYAHKHASTNSQSQSTTQTSPTPTPTPSPSPTPRAVNLQSYEQALTKYQYRFQFADCHTVTPDSISLRKGDAVMLDNRDSAAHTFKFGNQSYRVGGYDFAVATTQTVGNFSLMCDGATAVTLNVEP